MTPSSKLAAIGACALIAGAGGAAVAAVAVDGHGSSSSTASAASASSTPSTRPVSNGNMTAKQVYNEAKDSVAYIQAQTSQGTATGSGFVVTADGKIITNEHVVDGAQSVTVKLGVNGKAQTAQVLAADASKDLALLKINQSNLKPLSFADSSKVEVGDAVFAIGNPYGLDHTLTSGIVSALDRDIDAPDGTPIKDVIQTDAALNPGNSGGALIDGSGQVVGVNSQIASASSSESEAGNVGIGFAIPSNTVKAFVENPTSSSETGQQSQSQQSQGQSQQQLPQLGQDQQGQQSQTDPYGSGEQSDPYGQSQGQDEQSDPYGSQDQQSDPYGYGQDDQGQDDQSQGVPQLAVPMG
jgi:putative serine protease PepD